ncbi:MAG: hypothetical protein R3E96_01975 [Planctomycetota bacterium]
MRIVLVTCHRCRHQEKVEVPTEEKRDPRVPCSPVRRRRCGNPDVEVRS